MSKKTKKLIKRGLSLFIALALLPPEADIGTRLHYEMLCYTVIEYIPHSH